MPLSSSDKANLLSLQAASEAALAAERAAITLLIVDVPVVVPPPVIIPPAPAVTPDGYATSVTDSSGAVWTIVNAQLAKNGAVNGSTSTVAKLYAKAGQVYFVNSGGNWYIPNPSGTGSSTPTSDPTGAVVVTPPPASGNGFAQALTAPPGYAGKIGAPLWATDFKTANDPLFYPARNVGDSWSGPFNSGEQEIFTHDMAVSDGDVMWISTGKNDTGNRPDLPYKSGCLTTVPSAAVWGENTLLQARICFMPGPNNWQAGCGFGAIHGYPRECDWFELTDGQLALNKHYPNASGGNAETGQRGWGPSNPRDGQFHLLYLEWTPGKLVTYFDGAKALTMTCPTDSEKYSFNFNNAIRGPANLGKTMGIDWVALSPITQAA